MKPQLQLSAQQSQKLSPQLQLTLKLLQYSQAELEQEIEQALLFNPALERTDDRAGTQALGDTENQQPGEYTENEWPYSENGDYEIQPAPHDAEHHQDNLHASPSLAEHLRGQLHLCTLSPRDMAIAEAVLDSLQDDGYCLASTTEIAQACHITPLPEAAEVEAVRHFIRQLEPLGVASRTLAECLQVQLSDLVISVELRHSAQRIAQQYLSQVAKNAIAEIARNLSVPFAHAADAVALLKSLDPKPGMRFGQSRTDYIEPDFFSIKQQGHWQVHAARDSRAALRINRQFQQMAKKNSEQTHYLLPYVHDGMRLLAALKARQDTLKRITQALAERQPLFFEHGLAALQPMRLCDIASALGVHESTVSRACSGKYLATRHGVFALTRLFRSGIEGPNGQNQSSDAVQARIAALIAAESALKPLSDAQLVAHLQAEGHSIARRTVAKYREALRVAPSHLRRKKVL